MHVVYVIGRVQYIIFVLLYVIPRIHDMSGSDMCAWVVIYQLGKGVMLLRAYTSHT